MFVVGAEGSPTRRFIFRDLCRSLCSVSPAECVNLRIKRHVNRSLRHRSPGVHRAYVCSGSLFAASSQFAPSIGMKGNPWKDPKAFDASSSLLFYDITRLMCNVCQFPSSLPFLSFSLAGPSESFSLSLYLPWENPWLNI